MPMPMVEIELALMTIAHPEKSWGMKTLENPSDAAPMIWLPKSQVEIEHMDRERREPGACTFWRHVNVKMPQWLAEKRGLV